MRIVVKLTLKWGIMRNIIYRQSTIASRACQKLAKRYYRPFIVLARVGLVAYKLKLPSTSKIHSVFYSFVLKSYHGNNLTISHPLLELSMDNHPLLLSATICATRIVLQQGKTTPQVLVQWTDNWLENSTWENFEANFEAFCKLYPAFHLEDKVCFLDGGNDTNFFIKLDPSELVLVEEFNQEPISQEPKVNQPMNEVHHEPVQDNLLGWLKDYVV